MPFKLVISVAILLGLSACDQLSGQSSKASENPGKTRGERPAHAVEIILVSRQAVRINRTLTGTLEAPRTVHVHSEQSGRVIELPYYEGDKVKKGDLLARLDDALLRANIAKAVASRKQAEVDDQRDQ